MAEKLVAPMVGTLVVSGDYIVRFSAVSPTDGSAVTGVTITNVNVDGEVHGGAAELPAGKFMLVPGPGT